MDRAAVMAVSGGGYSAIHFALRHPDRCWGLVLISTTGGRIETPLPLAFHLLKVVHGTRDPLVPFAQHGQVLAARIPGAELLALEGGEHPAIFTHRAEARARVAAFLRERAPSPHGAGPQPRWSSE